MEFYILFLYICFQCVSSSLLNLGILDGLGIGNLLGPTQSILGEGFPLNAATGLLSNLDLLNLLGTQTNPSNSNQGLFGMLNSALESILPFNGAKLNAYRSMETKSQPKSFSTLRDERQAPKPAQYPNTYNSQSLNNNVPMSDDLLDAVASSMNQFRTMLQSGKDVVQLFPTLQSRKLQAILLPQNKPISTATPGNVIDGDSTSTPSVNPTDNNLANSGHQLPMAQVLKSVVSAIIKSQLIRRTMTITCDLFNLKNANIDIKETLAQTTPSLARLGVLGLEGLTNLLLEPLGFDSKNNTNTNFVCKTTSLALAKLDDFVGSLDTFLMLSSNSAVNALQLVLQSLINSIDHLLNFPTDELKLTDFFMGLSDTRAVLEHYLKNFDLGKQSTMIVQNSIALITGMLDSFGHSTAQITDKVITKLKDSMNKLITNLGQLNSTVLRLPEKLLQNGLDFSDAKQSPFVLNIGDQLNTFSKKVNELLTMLLYKAPFQVSENALVVGSLIDVTLADLVEATAESIKNVLHIEDTLHFVQSSFNSALQLLRNLNINDLFQSNYQSSVAYSKLSALDAAMHLSQSVLRLLYPLKSVFSILLPQLDTKQRQLQSQETDNLLVFDKDMLNQLIAVASPSNILTLATLITPQQYDSLLPLLTITHVNKILPLLNDNVVNLALPNLNEDCLKTMDSNVLNYLVDKLKNVLSSETFLKVRAIQQKIDQSKKKKKMEIPTNNHNFSVDALKPVNGFPQYIFDPTTLYQEFNYVLKKAAYTLEYYDKLRFQNCEQNVDTLPFEILQSIALVGDAQDLGLIKSVEQMIDNSSKINSEALRAKVPYKFEKEMAMYCELAQKTLSQLLDQFKFLEDLFDTQFKFLYTHKHV